MIRSPFFLIVGGLLPLLSTAPASVVAQTRAVVSGTATDAAAQPVPFATATLHQAADSVVVKSEFTDDHGAFRLEGAVSGRYRVSVAQVGLRRFWSEPFELTASGLSLPAITLEATGATQLKEVAVVGQKPLFEHFADRTVVNVEGNPLAAGATALELLRRAPGVTTDNADNLALRGRQGVLVLLDGKRVPMSGQELADLLRTMPAEQLKNIELITNPSAKYDAQGSAGIIAINRRQDQRLGTNASANLSYGRGQYGKFTTGLNLNHRRPKLNVFGGYSYTDRQGFTKLTIHRDFRDPGGEARGASDQDNHVGIHFLTHSARAGADFTLSKSTVLGVALNGQLTRVPQRGTNGSTVRDAAGAPLATYRSTNDQMNRSPNGSLNLNLRHSFAPTAAGPRDLTFDADAARYATRRRQALRTTFENSARPDSLVRGDQTGELTIRAVKADYSQALPHGARLETGLKSSFVAADNDVVFTNTVRDVSVPDPNQTNRFRYDENINAAYVNLSGAAARATFQVGLRAEQTRARGRQDIGNESFDREYLQWFPSAAGQVKLPGDRHEVGLSLSRRIDRPTYQQLNPFRSWIDATTYGSGNKDLRPQTSYNLELTETYRQNYSATLAYSYTQRPIVGVVQPESDTSRLVVSRDVNLAAQYYYAFTLTAPVELAAWCSVSPNVVAYYSRYAGNVAGTTLNRGLPAYNLSATGTFKLGAGWSADFNGTYQSREQYGFLVVRPLGEFALGVQKVAFNGRGTVKLNATDVFYTGKTRATSTYSNYTEQFYQRRDSRVVTLALTYRVGNEKLPPARRRTGGAEDEKRRAG